MNLKKLLLESSPQRLLILHVLLGGLCVVSRFFMIAWIYFCLAELWKYRNAGLVLKITLLSYIVGLEILCRMARTSPFVPFELGKYLLVFAPLILSRLRTERILYVGLLIPAILLGLFQGISFGLFVFNLFGWLAFIFFRMMTHKVDFTYQQLQRLLLILMLGSAGAVFLSFFKSPDISEIEFTLDANEATSGGFAPNQVATSFGLGIGILGILVLLRMRLFTAWQQIALLFFFIYRGILTFSRGGIIIGLLALTAVFLLDTVIQRKNVGLKMFLFLFMAASTTFAVFQINRISGGMFFKRLSGETIGTEYGIVEKDLNTATSGRLNIFIEDMDIFKEHLIFGSGVHISTLIRKENDPFNREVASHVEISRLFAEHGIMGIIFFLLVLYLFLQSFMSQRTSLGKYFVVFCFIFSIGTTFHSATRTFITPLMGGLAMIRVRQDSIPSTNSLPKVAHE